MCCMFRLFFNKHIIGHKNKNIKEISTVYKKDVSYIIMFVSDGDFMKRRNM